MEFRPGGGGGGGGGGLTFSNRAEISQRLSQPLNNRGGGGGKSTVF